MDCDAFLIYFCMMDIRALRYFVSVAQTGSFTRSAEVLRIAQPALSRQIRNLETELGLRLLNRLPRGVELTDSGHQLLSRAEDIIAMLKETVDKLKSMPAPARKKLSLGVPPATGAMLVPELVERFREANPHVSLSVREGVGSSLVEWLFEERIDLTVVHNPPNMPELIIEPLLTERMVLVLPPADVATSWNRPTGRSIDLREAASSPLILPSNAHTNRIHLESIMARIGETLTPDIEIDSVGITKAMVAAGKGATILTYAAVHQDVLAGTLSAIAIDNPPLISTLSLAYLRRRRHSDTLMAASKAVSESLLEIVRRGTWKGALSNSRLFLPSHNAR